MGFMKVVVHGCWLPVFVKPVPCQTLHLRQDPIRKAKDLLFSREEIVREKLASAKNIKEAMDARPTFHGPDARSFVTLSHSDWEVRSRVLPGKEVPADSAPPPTAVHTPELPLFDIRPDWLKNLPREKNLEIQRKEKIDEPLSAPSFFPSLSLPPFIPVSQQQTWERCTIASEEMPRASQPSRILLSKE